MQIDERVVDGVTILDLKGKMTLGEGDELLKDKINSLIQQDRKKLLLFWAFPSASIYRTIGTGMCPSWCWRRWAWRADCSSAGR